MADFYVQHEYWFAATQLILAMLGMGATLTGKDFRDVVREPRAVSSGLSRPHTWGTRYCSVCCYTVPCS